MNFLRSSKKSGFRSRKLYNVYYIDEICEDMVKAMYVDSQKKNPQNYSIKPEHKGKENKSHGVGSGEVRDRVRLDGGAIFR